MRSIETLVRSYPDKTGTEIIALQERDKKFDEDQYKKRNAKLIAKINDFNNNGAYFKSTFGRNQFRLDSFYNLRLDSSDNVLCDVKSIVIFKNTFRGTIEETEYRQLDQFMPQDGDRVTKADFNEVEAYLNNIFNFWN